MDLNSVNGLEIFDEEAKVSIMGLLGDDYLEILSDFTNTTPALISELEAAFLSDDKENIQSIAHKLKSGSSNLGMLAFAEACRVIEESMRVGNTLDRKEAIDAVQQQFQRARIDIEHLVNK